MGCVRTVHDCAHDIDNRLKKSQLDERTLQTSLTKRYPLLGHFPYSVQKLISAEESKVNSRIQEGKIAGDFEFINSIYICFCRFFHRYQLPCRHIFQKDRQTPFLTEDIWTMYSIKFREKGMEVFETPIPNSRNPRETAEVGATEGRVTRVLQVREVNERIRSTFYTLEESQPAAALAFVNALLREVNLLLDRHLLQIPEESQLGLPSSALPSVSLNQDNQSISLLVRILLSSLVDSLTGMLIPILDSQ